MSADQLDKLAGAAEQLAPTADDQVEDPNAPPAPPAPAPPGNFEAIAFLLASFREVFSKITETTSLYRTLADPQVGACAQVLAPLADKYGINLGGYLGGPEGLALVTAGPILWTAYRELNAELSARRKPAALAEPEPSAPAAPMPADGG